MTKQTDRLTRVEGKVDEIGRTVNAYFIKLDKLVDPENGYIIKLGRDNENIKATQKVYTWILGIAFIAIIGGVVKIFMG